MERMKDMKFNCTRCGSCKFEIIGNVEQTPISLSEPVEYKKILKYTVRCADCKEPIGDLPRVRIVDKVFEKFIVERTGQKYTK